MACWGSVLRNPCEGEAGNRQTIFKIALLAAWCVASQPSLRWMLTALSQPAHVVQLGVLLCLTSHGLYAFFSGAQRIEAHPKALPIALLGIAGAVLHAISPKITQIILNAAFRMFPDSSAAQAKKGEVAKEVEMTPEAMAFAQITQGIHW
mgnify:CR=1 FL=1